MDDLIFDIGMLIDGLQHLSAKQAYQCYHKGAVVVDVREDFEIAIKDFGITGVIYCPFSSFGKLYNSLPANKPLILVDYVGLHSKEAAYILIEKGFPNIANMVGGIAAWERAGLPMQKSVENMTGQCPCTMRSRSKE